MVQGVFSWVDLVAAPFWLMILYTLAYAIAVVKYKDPYLRKHFMWGLTVKFIGCFGFIAVYALYYGAGDTFNYYHNANKLMSVIIEYPPQLWTILTSTSLDLAQQIAVGLDEPLAMSHSAANFTVIRFAVFFGLFTFNSYVASSLLFAFASFLGVWALYRVVVYLFPYQYRAVTIPLLYIPSVFFWGSSMMKDSIVIGFLGLLTYGIYRLYFQRRQMIINLILVVFSFYVLTNVKQYVIIAYAPALIVWMSLGPVNKLSRAQRWVLTPLLLTIAVGIVLALLPMMEKLTARYALDQIMETAEVTANYIHRTTREGGSSYSLGKVSYTPAGMVAVFPRAVTVTLFQPFLYQVRNPVMLLSAIESTVFLFGTLYILFRVGFFRFIRYITDEPFLLMCLVFSIVFAFAIGISTYNFGSLVRYKIPALPFYGIAIIIPYMLYKKEVASKGNKRTNH